jgi:hypothetical protein
VEDTGLPRLLRDAQVLPIWEGTTNVLSLDLLRAAGKELDFGPLEREIAAAAGPLSEPALVAIATSARETLARAVAWAHATARTDPLELEAGARRFALTAGRCLEVGLLARHAEWCKRELGDARPLEAAKRLATSGVDLLRTEITRAQSEALAQG